jgi:hypothetical protein
MMKRTDHFAGTVSELMDWMIGRGLGVDLVMITGTHLKWESPETDQERERRLDWERQQATRTEEWERQTLARLKLKYEAL